MGKEPHCAFCRIIGGIDPARVIATASAAIGFLPLRPAVAGHVLVVPHQHVETLSELDQSMSHALADLVLTVARQIDDVLHPDGLNIMQSNNSAASQSMMHLHVHLVPRAANDGLPPFWPPPRDWTPPALDDLAIRLRIDTGGHLNAITNNP